MKNISGNPSKGKEEKQNWFFEKVKAYKLAQMQDPNLGKNQWCKNNKIPNKRNFQRWILKYDEFMAKKNEFKPHLDFFYFNIDIPTFSNFMLIQNKPQKENEIKVSEPPLTFEEEKQPIEEKPPHLKPFYQKLNKISNFSYKYYRKYSFSFYFSIFFLRHLLSLSIV
jgi:hypothetical protein